MLAKYAIAPPRQRTLFDKDPADWKFDDEAREIDEGRRAARRIWRIEQLNAELRAAGDEAQRAAW